MTMPVPDDETVRGMHADPDHVADGTVLGSIEDAVVSTLTPRVSSAAQGA